MNTKTMKEVNEHLNRSVSQIQCVCGCRELEFKIGYDGIIKDYGYEYYLECSDCGKITVLARAGADNNDMKLKRELSSKGVI